MTSQVCNNNDLYLFPLQIWKQPLQINCSDQFRVNKRDTECFEILHEENTKPSVNISVSHAWSFFSTSGFLCFLQRGGEGKRGEEWRNSHRMREGFWSSCDYFLPYHFCREEFCDLQKQHSRGDMKIIYMRNEILLFQFELHNFGKQPILYMNLHQKWIPSHIIYLT